MSVVGAPAVRSGFFSDVYFNGTAPARATRESVQSGDGKRAPGAAHQGMRGLCRALFWCGNAQPGVWQIQGVWGGAELPGRAGFKDSSRSRSVLPQFQPPHCSLPASRICSLHFRRRPIPPDEPKPRSARITHISIPRATGRVARPARRWARLLESHRTRSDLGGPNLVCLRRLARRAAISWEVRWRLVPTPARSAGYAALAKEDSGSAAGG